MSKPTPPAVSGAKPLVGHALEFRNGRTELFQRGYRECGLVFSIQLANKDVAVLLGPDQQREFFMQTDKALDMSKPYRFLRAMFGDVLFAASHETYVKQRPIFLEPFKRDKMLRYVEVMQQQVQKWLDLWDDEGELELTGQINYLVQQVAGHAFLGPDFMEQVGEEFWNQYTVLSEGLDPLLPPDWPLPKFKRRDEARARMHEILTPIIAERRASPERYDDFLQDFVNQRYKDGSPVEDEVLLGMILGLMFAGHETTAGQAAWTLILLLQHPEYLQRVQQELAETLRPGEPFEMRDLGQLRHIEWAVRETERLRPSVDLLLRSVEEEIDVNGFRLPAGWLAMVVPPTAHQLSFLFDDPQTFDPLRYAPGRQEEKQDRFSLIGFGGGGHKCLGMNFANTEMMIIAALLFQQFEVTLLTAEPRVVSGTGAARPSETWIRYRRLR